jgi:hypothetical protein
MHARFQQSYYYNKKMICEPLFKPAKFKTDAPRINLLMFAKDLTDGVSKNAHRDHMDFTSGDDDDDALIYEKQKTIFHFTYINNLSRLISKQVGNGKKKKWFCERCLNRFLNEGVLKKHLDDCKVLNETKMILPNENNKIMKFTNFKNKIQVGTFCHLC